MTPDAFLAVHRPAMVRLAVRLGHDAATAEDVAQDALVRAWRAWDTFRGEERARLGWLYAITRNLAYDRHRSDRRSRSESLDIEGSPWLRIASPDDAVSATETRADVQAFLDELSPRNRVIFLRTVAGETSIEVAAALGMTPLAVRARMHRARVTAGYAA